jgi:putative oxidoreductase
MEIIFIIGRVLLGGYFIYSGFGHFKNYKNTTAYAKMKGVPMANVGVIVTGLLMFLGVWRCSST